MGPPPAPSVAHSQSRGSSLVPAGRGQHGRPPQPLLRHRAGSAAPAGDHPGPGHHGPRAPHPVLQVHALQAHTHHLLPRRRLRGPVSAGGRLAVCSVWALRMPEGHPFVLHGSLLGSPMDTVMWFPFCPAVLWPCVGGRPGERPCSLQPGALPEAWWWGGCGWGHFCVWGSPLCVVGKTGCRVEATEAW